MKQLEGMSNQQKYVIFGGVVLLLIIGGFIMMGRGGSSVSENGSQEEVLPDTVAYPTVDASVIVELTADRLKREVTLDITGVPTGTESIEYELSYLAEGDLPKGVIGTIDVEGKSTVQKTGITLGTCSSGACVYDKGVESVRVSLKFNLPDGPQIFEKEFEI